MSLTSEYDVFLSVPGVSITGKWDTMTGGEAMSEESKYLPGGGEPERTYAGPQKTGNVVVSRWYDRTRDHQIVHALMGKVGRVICTVTKQPIDANRVPFGKALVYTGRLLRVTPPPVNSNETTVAMLEVEISTHGGVG